MKENTKLNLYLGCSITSCLLLIALIIMAIAIQGCDGVDRQIKKPDGTVENWHIYTFVTDTSIMQGGWQEDKDGAVNIGVNGAGIEQSKAAGDIDGAVTKSVIEGLKISSGTP